MIGNRQTEVVVVGAGPVGLMAALSLKSAGVDVQIYDAGLRTAEHSYALVLHPSTLELLDRFGLANACIKVGRAVTHLGIYEGAAKRGDLDFTRLAGPHRQIVVLPQSQLESILESALEKAGVKVGWSHRVQGLDVSAVTVRLTVAKLDKVSTGYPIAHTEAVVDKTFEVDASYGIAADGYDSFVRRRLGVTYADQGRGQLYSVFQFECGGDAPQDARLTIEGDVVGGYWPMPEGRCRFSFPIYAAEEHRPDAEHLRGLLASRAPWFTATAGPIEWTALGLFERKLVTSFGSGRVWLAGDAAHLTDLGGQSMNVGLREADDLASKLKQVIRGASASVLDEYATGRAAEWKKLFGAQAPFGSRVALLLPCLPASGPDLDALVAQLG